MAFFLSHRTGSAIDPVIEPLFGRFSSRHATVVPQSVELVPRVLGHFDVLLLLRVSNHTGVPHAIDVHSGRDRAPSKVEAHCNLDTGKFIFFSSVSKLIRKGL